MIGGGCVDTRKGLRRGFKQHEVRQMNSSHVEKEKTKSREQKSIAVNSKEIHANRVLTNDV
jgi:hypothetical protein